MTFSLKVGDTGPLLTVTLDPIYDLTGASAVFSMKDASGAIVVSAAACTISGDTVSYAWQAADTDTRGSYRGEFVVTLASNRETTFPTEVLHQYIEIEIEESFGAQPVPAMPLIFDGSWILDGSQTLDGVKN